MKLWRKNPRPRAATKTPRKISFGVHRLLQINFAVLVPLGAMMLGMGQHEMTRPAAVLIAAISASYLTDQWGWIRLNRIVANVAALIATGASVSQLIHVSSGEQLLAIAHLLIYLQVILLFQQKTVRVYWQLLVLSGLEVVVATAVNSSLLFGVMLVVYLFVALAALGLIFILGEAEHHLAHAAPPKRKPSPTVEIDGGKPKSRWPLRREIQIVSVPSSDLPRQILGSGIFWRTSGIGIGTVVVATVCFFFLPRFGKALVDVTGQQATVGYNPVVKLGDMGPLLQNPELVMRVEFRDKTGEPIAPANPPLLRGSLLNHYHQGEWKLDFADTGRPGPLGPPPDGVEIVREHITIEAMSETVLFSVYPPYQSDDAKSLRYVRYEPDRQRLVRTGGGMRSRELLYGVQSQELEYEVLTTGLRGGHQARIVPKLWPQEHEMYHLLQLPDDLPPGVKIRIDQRDQITGLRTLAATKVREAQVPNDDHYEKAKLLERVLNSPPFEYTLDRPPSEPGLDPIEDFVTRNPRGHCEYFASALTLMLRSQGIPARMVIGFHGGDWNPDGSYYEVRQLHAHAWVEAYLSAEQIKKVPPRELPPGLPGGDGAWLILDPTPSAQMNDTFAAGSFMSSIAELSDYVQVLWNTYVIGLNSERQNKAIYKPLADFGRALEKLATNPKQAIGDMFAHLRHWLFGGGDPSDSGLDWYVLAALVLLAVAALLIYRLIRSVMRTCLWLFKLRRCRVAARSRVEFYRRFESLLARHGIRRDVGQTQLELAHCAAERLTATLGPRRAAALPSRLVAAFYRVRFGHATLDVVEAAAVEQLLFELAERLRRGIGGKGQGAGDEEHTITSKPPEPEKPRHDRKRTSPLLP